MKKKIYIEALRIFALFWVIYNHTSIYSWTLFSNNDISMVKAETILNWFLFVFCKISVPLFLMISGALLLGRDEPLRTNAKRIRRIVMLILVNGAANCVYFLHIHHEYAHDIHNIWDFIKELYSGTNLCTYYLWLYLGFLIALPILQSAVKMQGGALYATMLFVFFEELLPMLELRFELPHFNLTAYSGVFAMYYVAPMLGYVC